MKKLLILAILITEIVFSSTELRACHYSFNSKVDQVKIGEVFDVKVTVIYEHRRCVIELDDTQFNLTGLEWIGQGEWEMEKRGTYSKAHIDPEKCEGCGQCKDICRHDAVEGDSGTPSFDMDRCIFCGVCAEACTHDALALIKQTAVIDEGQCNGCEACISACRFEAIQNWVPQ